MLSALAGGRVVVALEVGYRVAVAAKVVALIVQGGYNLEAISRSALAVAQVLLGENPAEMGPLKASEAATEVIHQVAKVQSKYWKSIDVKACEPPEVEATEEHKPVIPVPGKYRLHMRRDYSLMPDLLKIYRAHHMFSKYNLFQVPLASTELEDAFGGQVMCK